MKLVISQAWIGDRLILKPSWTKGGIGRAIDITNNEQKEWLEALKQVSHGQLLKTYKQYLRQYQTETEKLGLKNCHGLRHAYAQKRYHEITSQLSPDKKPFKCPIEGGKPSKYMSKLERAIDREARGNISQNSAIPEYP